MSAGRVVVLGGATARTAGAVLRAFLDAGYRVVATARRPEAVRQTLARLPGGEGVEVVEADLHDPRARRGWWRWRRSAAGGWTP